jgi:RNA polymerase-binding transcription factor
VRLHLLKGEHSVPNAQKKATHRSEDALDIDALRDRLLRQRDDILSMYRQDLRAGQESTDDGTEDIVDRANNSYNRELMFSLSDGERQMLLEVEAALKRLELESYGKCINCGRAIAPKRLQALPWARYCIDCQELEEKGLLADND